MELHGGQRPWWVEMRAEEAGRAVVVEAPSGGGAGEPTDLLPPPLSAKSRVFEYDGAATARVGDVLCVVDDDDQQVHRVDPDGTVTRLTPGDGRRYGDLEPDPGRHRLLAVCEDHRASDLSPPVTVVAVPLDGGEPVPLLSGRDFYAAPRVSPDGWRLAWAQWDLPAMPWDGSRVLLADLDDAGRPGPPRVVAGDETYAAAEPVWSPDGVLHLLANGSGWWNVHALDAGGLRPAAPMSADCGHPSGLDLPGYDVDETHVVLAPVADGVSSLVLVHRSDGSRQTLPTGLTSHRLPRLTPRGVVFLGSSPRTAESVWFQPRGADAPVPLRDSGAVGPDPALLADPEHLTAAARDGGVVHAWYYPPLSTALAGAAGRPPLVVMVHGGPVGAARTGLMLGPYALAAAVYWTSRGYAFVDVDYRGSTGYGRAYRDSLYGRWGELDVSDCVDVVAHLVARGDADPARVVVRGGSAGGYTTLMAMVSAADVFAAGTAYFPVADLDGFHAVTHKFESGYDTVLVGDRAVVPGRFAERSPLHRADEVRSPVLVVQGLADRICPPEQSEEFVQAVSARGGDAVYLAFEGEGHGFVQPWNIEASLVTEEAFYARVLGHRPV
jgi:dipeptidyl aminopeptidase/acylaminoacyl peptidase